MDGADILSDLTVLTKAEILSAGKTILFGHADKHKQALLAETISLLAVEEQQKIRRTAIEKQVMTSQGHQAKRIKTTHKHEGPVGGMAATMDNRHVHSGFLQAASQETVH